jgi:hypothetical protein
LLAAEGAFRFFGFTAALLDFFWVGVICEFGGLAAPFAGNSLSSEIPEQLTFAPVTTNI